MLIKITSLPSPYVLKLCEKPFRLVAVYAFQAAAPPLKPSHLEGIYVVYNNEIDLTWWQCHVWGESWRQDDDEKVVMLSTDTRSSVHHSAMIEETTRAGVMYCWERFIPDGINQTEQVFYHSLRYTKMEEIQSASRQPAIPVRYLALSRRVEDAEKLIPCLTSHHDARQYQLATLFVWTGTWFERLVLFAINYRYCRRNCRKENSS